MTSGLSRRSFALPSGWLNTTSSETTNLEPGFLLLATVLAAALRLFHLNAQSLWVDELLTWQMIRPGLDLVFTTQMLDSIQGPLLQAVLWPLIRWQDTDWVLRLPSLVAGIALIPLFGVVVTRMLGTRAARLAVLLLAISPFHIWYSQEGRGYAFLMFFSVAMGGLFLDMVRRGPGPSRAIGFALLSACAVLSNMSGLFLWLALGATLLVFYRPTSGRQWGLWTMAFGAGLLLMAPWLLKASGIWAVDRVLPGVATGTSLRGETTFSLLALPYTVFTFFFGTTLGPSLSELHQPDRLAVIKSAAPLLVLGAIPVATGLLWGIVKLERRRWYLLVWMAVPVLILVLLAQRNIKPWNPRYLAMVFPWVLALAALGLARLPNRPAFLLTCVLVVLSLWSVGGYFFDDRYAKADIRAAVEIVNQNKTEQAIVLAPTITAVFKYYDRSGTEVLGSFGEAQLANLQSAEDFVVDRLAGYDTCWVVLARQWYFDPGGYLVPALSRMGHLRLESSPPGVKVYSWMRKPTAPTQGEK